MHRAHRPAQFVRRLFGIEWPLAGIGDDGLGASEHTGTGKDRVMQGAQKHRIFRRQPRHRVNSRAQVTNRILQTLTTPPLEHLSGAAEFVELLEHRHDRMHDRLVAALHPLSEFVEVIPSGRNGVQLTACRLSIFNAIQCYRRLHQGHNNK